jgi:hypothetical protein
MNQNLNLNGGQSWSVMQKAVSLAGVVIISGLALGMWEFNEWRGAKARVDGNEMAFNKLTEVAQISFLIRRISDGKPEEAKQLLSFKLREDLLELRSSLPNTDDSTRGIGGRICDHIVQTERAHPEYFLPASPLKQADLNKAWAVFGTGSFKSAAGGSAVQ